MLEGIGGPIKVNHPDLSDIDPTLDDCCRREAESNRRFSALQETLQKHDKIALAERLRRNVLPDLSFGIGCRCCYDPNSDGGEYDALTKARQNLRDFDNSNELYTNDKEEQSIYINANNRLEYQDVSNDSEEDSEFDYLLDDDVIHSSKLYESHSERRLELQHEAFFREYSLLHGYGVHRQMHPRRVFQAAGLNFSPSSRILNNSIPPGVVLHLYDPNSYLSASLDLCLEDLSTKYRGTRFLRSIGRLSMLLNADLGVKVLPRLNSEKDLPALVAVKEGVVINVCPRLSGMGHGSVEPRAVENWLGKASVLHKEVLLQLEDMCSARINDSSICINVRKDQLIRNDSEMISGIDTQIYSCGVAGCQKTFRHEHIGVLNQQQSGLLVPKEYAYSATSSNDLC